MPSNYTLAVLSKWSSRTYTWGVVNGVYQVVSVTPAQGTESGYGIYRNRMFSGSRYPNYRTFRSINGYVPTQNCSDTIISRQSSVYNYYNVMSDGSGRVNFEKESEGMGSHPTNQSLSSPEFTDLANANWSKLRQKVLNQDFNAPVFFAELGKTVNMIVDKSTRLVQAYTSFRKGRFRKAAEYLGLSRGTVHNTWLEYKYGWMPLLQDIHGAAKALADSRYRTRRPRFLVSKNRKMPVTEFGYSGSFDLQAKAWVLLKLGAPSAAAANRIGLLNPLVVLWEIIPFSFVGDWFVNIGDCLLELTAFAGVTILDGGSSKSSVCNASYRRALAPFQYGTYGVTVSYQRSYQRTAGVQTIPTLRRKEDPLAGIAKALTSLSLLRQRLPHEAPPRKPSLDRGGDVR